MYEAYQHTVKDGPPHPAYRRTEQVLVPLRGDYMWVAMSDPRAAESLARADAGECITGYDGYRFAAFRRRHT